MATGDQGLRTASLPFSNRDWDELSLDAMMLFYVGRDWELLRIEEWLLPSYMMGVQREEDPQPIDAPLHFTTNGTQLRQAVFWVSTKTSGISGGGSRLSYQTGHPRKIQEHGIESWFPVHPLPKPDDPSCIDRILGLNSKIKAEESKKRETVKKVGWGS
jgi:hypothetical protein